MTQPKSIRQVLSFSLPPSELAQLRRSVKSSGATLSAFVREAIQRRLLDMQWREIRRLGKKTAKKFKVSPEDLEEIVDEFRD